MSKYWEPCPRCGSNKVKTIGKSFWFLIGIGMASFLFLFGIFILPLLIVALIVFVLSFLSFSLPKVNQCEDCKKTWKVNKSKKASA